MKQLKELRKKYHLTQKELANSLNLDPSSISKYESSNAAPSPEILLKLANFFNVSTDYLLGNNNVNTNLNNKAKKDLTSKDNRDIAKDMERIREKLMNKEDGPASFDGENISEESAELLLTQIESMLRTIKVINKEKYNPYKNKEGNANGEN